MLYNNGNVVLGIELAHHVKANQTENAKILLAANAPTNACIGKNKNYPLHYAAKNNNPILVEELLKHGADLTKKNAKGTTPIILAASYGHWKVVEVMVKHAKATTAIKNINGNTLLFAIYFSQFELTEQLLRSGVALTGRCKIKDDEFSALHCAVLKNNPKMVALLLHHGADTSIKATHQQITPIHYAAHLKYWECVKAFAIHSKENGKSDFDKALRITVEEKQLEVAELLLRAGAATNKNASYADEDVVYLAAKNKQPKMIALLVVYGANPNKTYSDGRYALGILRTGNGNGDDELITKCIEALLKPEKIYKPVAQTTSYYLPAPKLFIAMLWLIRGTMQTSSKLYQFPLDLISLIVNALPGPSNIHLSAQTFVDGMTIALAKLVVKNYNASWHFPRSEDSVEFINNIAAIGDEKSDNNTKSIKIKNAISSFAKAKANKKSDAVTLLIKHHLLAPKLPVDKNNNNSEGILETAVAIKPEQIIEAAKNVVNEYNSSWHYPRSNLSKNFIGKLTEIIHSTNSLQQKMEAIQNEVAIFYRNNWNRKSEAMDLLRKYNFITLSSIETTSHVEGAMSPKFSCG